jgi:hypothetical protein
MSTVIFKTEEAKFQFDRSAVIKQLERLISDPNFTENKGQLELLLNSAEDLIQINSDISSFEYTALDLIEHGSGQVTCKKCNRTYNGSELKPITIGFGKSPIDLNINMKGGIRNIFRHKKRNPSMFGGKGYLCPEGHQLLSMITWRT